MFINKLIGPFSYLYVRTVLRQEYKLSKTDYLFARPKILYGRIGWLQEENPIVSLKYSPNNSYVLNTPQNKTTSLSIDEGKNYKSKIESYFASNTQYLNPGFTISDLSKEINTPIYQLSAFINQEYQKSFVQFINDHRFEYFLMMKNEDPDFKNYTIDYLGKKIGFSSRTSFVEFIKKRTGKTPLEFLKEN